MNKLAKMLVLGLTLLMVFPDVRIIPKTDTHEENQEVMRFSVTRQRTV